VSDADHDYFLSLTTADIQYERGAEYTEGLRLNGLFAGKAIIFLCQETLPERSYGIDRTRHQLHSAVKQLKINWHKSQVERLVLAEGIYCT